MFKRKWQEVYERLPIERKNQSLSAISGFTNFIEDPVALRKSVVNRLRAEINTSKKVNVCEVGCGCGDKLGHFYDLGYPCYGVDYSKSMIARAKEVMPKARIFVSSADRLPFEDNSMHFIFSYSVFIYFETQAYFYKVLSEMYRIAKPDAKICIWEVPDVRDKKEVIAFRGRAKPGYGHTYYDMNDFFVWFKKKEISFIKSEYVLVPGYKHSHNRFNVTVQLNKTMKSKHK